MSSHAAPTPGRGAGTLPEKRRRNPRPGDGSPAALGGEPRVSLLPAEVHDFHRARLVRRRLVGFFIVAVIVVAAGVAGAFVLSTAAQAARDAAQAETLALVTQEAEYAELRKVQSGIALVEAGQLVGASTEIDWKTYLENLQETLPDGVVITSVGIDTASPFADYAQSGVPLEGSRVATVTFAANSPSLPSIPVWLDGLATLTGFADATPGSLAQQSDGSYVVNITMHINSDAFALRFAEETE